MSFLYRAIAKITANAVALSIADRFIKGFDVAPQAFPIIDQLAISPLIQSLVVGGAILGALNIFVRPIFRVISFPLLLITLGLFDIVINFAILYLADIAFAELTITGILAYLYGSLLIGLVNRVIK